jgi:hypothetical protein
MTNISQDVLWLIDAIHSLESDIPVQRGTPGYNNYTTQKAHWLGWLTPNSGTGTYDRSSSPNRTAKDIYNRIVEPKMLLWLAEAAGVDNDLLNAAKEDASKLPKLASQSAAIRRHIPWQTIFEALETK